MLDMWALALLISKSVSNALSVEVALRKPCNSYRSMYIMAQKKVNQNGCVFQGGITFNT